jgi:hypothetical protein
MSSLCNQDHFGKKITVSFEDDLSSSSLVFLLDNHIAEGFKFFASSGVHKI